jgi:DNA polymerase-3 subunit beta
MNMILKMDLLLAVNLAGKVVERRSSIPILECVRLSGSGVVDATDLDMALTIQTKGTVADAPSAGVAVPHADLAAALAKTDGSLRAGDQISPCSLRVGESPAVLLPVNKNDWISLKGLEDAVSCELVASELALDLADVRAGMSKEETRYYLNGMLWHVSDGCLRLAATDGHRLHRVSRAVPPGFEGLRDSIVPRKAIRVLSEMLACQPNVTTVRAEFGNLRASFTVGAASLTTKLIDGTFPDYKRAIPADAKSGMKLRPEDLIDLAELVSGVMGKDAPLLVLDMLEGTVAAKNPEGVKIEGRLAREIFGEPVSAVGFRHEYVATSLRPFIGRGVTMSLADPASPCLITAEGDERVLVVLMPMRV